MINPTRNVEIKLAEFVTQFNCKTYKRCNSRFYATRVRLKEVYLIKYNRNEYISTLNPFKVRVLGSKIDAFAAKVWLTIDDPLRR